MAPCPCFGGTARAKRTRWYWCCCCWCWWWWSRWFPFFGGTARARKMRYESKCTLDDINVDQRHIMNAWLPKILLRVEMNPYWLLQLFQSDKTNGLCRINPVTKTGQRLYMVSSDILDYYEWTLTRDVSSCFKVLIYIAPLPGAHAASALPADHGLDYAERHHTQHLTHLSGEGWWNERWSEISWNIVRSSKASDFVYLLQAKSFLCDVWWFSICFRERLRELEPKWTRPLFWRSSSPTCKGSDPRWFRTMF